VFLGERETGVAGRVLMDANYGNHFKEEEQGKVASVVECLEVWDYAGGVVFRGFVGEKMGVRSLFVFWGESVVDRELKQG